MIALLPLILFFTVAIFAILVWPRPSRQAPEGEQISDLTARVSTLEVILLDGDRRLRDEFDRLG